MAEFGYRIRRPMGDVKRGRPRVNDGVRMWFPGGAVHLSSGRARGQSLVELAVMMPLLVLILAGILDLGRAYMTLIALRDAAAEGAAYAALHPEDTEQIVERVADSSSGLVTIDPDLVTVECPEVTPGQPITVIVRYEYSLLTPVVNALVPDGKITMQAQEVRSIIQ